MFRSSPSEVFSKKDLLHTQSEPTGEQPQRSAISTMLLCNLIKVTNTHGRAPENPGRIMLHIMYTIYAYIYIIYDIYIYIYINLYIVIIYTYILYLLSFLSFMVCISYSMKTILVMVKGNSKSACRKKFQKFCQFCFPLTLPRPNFFFFSSCKSSGLNF